ncbi:MAG TPA: hypothetical protein PK447_08675, partial [Ignavibacteria bacterium]|nr:hypothetical protein [Ignavibacteria bacterium]
SEYIARILEALRARFGDDVSEVEFDKLNPAKMCGVINDLQIKISKRGKKFVVFRLADFYSSGECIAFESLYEANESLFKEDTPVLVEGKAEENGDKIKLVVDNIYNVETYQERQLNNIVINISENQLDEELLRKTKSIAESNPGSCRLFFHLIKNGSSRLFNVKETKIRASRQVISELKSMFGESNIKLN